MNYKSIQNWQPENDPFLEVYSFAHNTFFAFENKQKNRRRKKNTIKMTTANSKTNDTKANWKLFT